MTTRRKPGVTRAKRKAQSPAAKSKMVFAIAKRMAAGEWQRGKASEEMAEETGLAVTTVQDMAGEAHRLLQFSTGYREKLLELLRVRLLEILLEDGTDRVPAIRLVYESMGELSHQTGGVGRVAPATRLPREELIGRLMDGLLADPEHRRELQRRLSLVTDGKELTNGTRTDLAVPDINDT